MKRQKQALQEEERRADEQLKKLHAERDRLEEALRDASADNVNNQRHNVVEDTVESLIRAYSSPTSRKENARRRVAARLPRAPCKVRKLKATASPGSISHSRIRIPSASGSGTGM